MWRRDPMTFLVTHTALHSHCRMGSRRRPGRKWLITRPSSETRALARKMPIPLGSLWNRVSDQNLNEVGRKKEDTMFEQWNKRRFTRGSQRGFTLIELMIVVA